MKILQIPRRYVQSEWGGTETVIKKTAQALLELGSETEIWTSSALSRPGRDVVDGILVTRFPYTYPVLGLTAEMRRGMDKIGGNLLSFAMMKELLGRDDFDVYHLHTGKRLGSQAAFVAKRRKKPYLLTLHGSHITESEHAEQVRKGPGHSVKTIEWGKLFGAALGSRSLLQNASAVICVDAEEVGRLQSKLGLNNVLHIPNGVDEKDFSTGDGQRFRTAHGFKSTDKLISCISRIDPQKNQMCLLRAFHSVASNVKDAHLLIIGPHTNPEYVESLRREVSRLNLQQRVHIHGQLNHGSNDLADAYAAADVFALASVHEPFGIAVLEAWCAGKPVVVSKVGGMQHVVDDSQNGLMVQSEDSDGFAKSILKILNTPGMAEAFGAHGKAKALSKYSWHTIAKQLMDLYLQVQKAPFKI